MDSIPQLLPSQYELLVAFRDGARPIPEGMEELARILRDMDLIRPVLDPARMLEPAKLWELTELGKLALQAYELTQQEKGELRQYMAQQEADQAANRKMQVKIAVLTVVCTSVLTWLLNLLSRDWTPVLDLLNRLANGG